MKKQIRYPANEQSGLFVVSQGTAMMFAETCDGSSSRFMGRFNQGSLVGCVLYENWPSHLSLRTYSSSGDAGEVLKRTDPTRYAADFLYAAGFREARMFAAAAQLSAICHADLHEGILYAVALLNGEEGAKREGQILFGGHDIAQVVGSTRETASREFKNITSAGKLEKKESKYFITEKGKAKLDLELLRTLIH